MELAENLGFSSLNLRFINHCSFYLNAISLIDTVSMSGKGMDPLVVMRKKLPAQGHYSCIQQKADHTKCFIWFSLITAITREKVL
jgi:hypothetical protein